MIDRYFTMFLDLLKEPKEVKTIVPIDSPVVISHWENTLWWTNSLQLKMAIEIVDFPIKNGDFPLLCESSPEGIFQPSFDPTLEATNEADSASRSLKFLQVLHLLPEPVAHDTICEQGHVQQFMIFDVPSGKLTVCYWTWPFIIDLPIQNADVP